MSTIVGTNIEVTNIKYDSDTTSMIISNAGQVTVQGEGTATTNLQGGLAKAICKHSSVAFTHTTNGLNYSTFTDHGTGDHTLSFTNNMTDIHYTITWMNEGKFDVYRFVCLKVNDYSYTTGPRVNTGYFTHTTALTIADLGENGNVVYGELA